MNCLGRLSRDSGHMRVPDPPHMITGRILVIGSPHGSAAFRTAGRARLLCNSGAAKATPRPATPRLPGPPPATARGLSARCQIRPLCGPTNRGRKRSKPVGSFSKSNRKEIKAKPEGNQRVCLPRIVTFQGLAALAGRVSSTGSRRSDWKPASPSRIGSPDSVWRGGPAAFLAVFACKRAAIRPILA